VIDWYTACVLRVTTLCTQGGQRKIHPGDRVCLRLKLLTVTKQVAIIKIDQLLVLVSNEDFCFNYARTKRRVVLTSIKHFVHSSFFSMLGRPRGSAREDT
jgi:hypothetical protein